MLNVDFSTLRAFAAFAEHLNFTHAADELFISQPALHMKVQQLANTLDVPLYTKIGRRLELTEQGLQVARFARQMLSQAEAFGSELHGGASSQPIVLAGGEGTFLYILGNGIKQFLRQSKTPLKLITANREGVIEAVVSGKAHIGVASLETVPDGCQSTLLSRCDQMLVMPKGHALATRKSLRLTSLQGQSLIVPSADRPHRQILARALQSAEVDWQVAVEANGWELMLHFVKLGLGLAIVNSMVSLPAGLVSRKLTELPQVHYHLFHLSGAAREGTAAAQLKSILLSES